MIEEDQRGAEKTRSRTGANMFEKRGIPFVLLDLICLVLGMPFTAFSFHLVSPFTVEKEQICRLISSAC